MESSRQTQRRWETDKEFTVNVKEPREALGCDRASRQGEVIVEREWCNTASLADKELMGMWLAEAFLNSCHNKSVNGDLQHRGEFTLND